jgi:hypothetical protein
MRFSIQMLCRGGHVRIETRIDGSIHVRFPRVAKVSAVLTVGSFLDGERAACENSSR